ncbi:transcriptional regulator (plasmid) [Sphingobium sp. SCG-1]|uniref:MerR family transcriptional regulator n=1 Tax=Sphingobium sp. SCG-1 TaxID=2072936 RepID=UPI000CD69E48|nr:helix-turn-helix domain-containing protein [Sphingobium sp. SCG-1]AUW60527.1 transcriptional regulator [Sphingobium sp. SCG-1]
MTISGFMIPIGELSHRTGCNIETIRYYERIGVLPVPHRRGRYRTYGASDVRRLSFVRRARELGFPIDAVRVLLAIADGGAPSCEQASDLASAHLKEVRVKIADLRRMEQLLSKTVDACQSGDNVSCPLLETLCTAELPEAVTPLGISFE